MDKQRVWGKSVQRSFREDERYLGVVNTFKHVVQTCSDRNRFEIVDSGYHGITKVVREESKKRDIITARIGCAANLGVMSDILAVLLA